MNITLKDTKLPSTYRKIAQLDIATAFQKWVTVAHFRSDTSGCVDGYWMYRHGMDTQPHPITSEQYYGLIREFYATTPKEKVDGKCIMFNAVTTTERIAVAQSLSIVPEPVRTAAKSFRWLNNELIGENVPKDH